MPEKSPHRPLVVMTKNVLDSAKHCMGDNISPIENTVLKRSFHTFFPGSPQTYSYWFLPNRGFRVRCVPMGCLTAVKKVSASASNLHLPWHFSNSRQEVVILHLFEYYQFIPCCCVFCSSFFHILGEGFSVPYVLSFFHCLLPQPQLRVLFPACLTQWCQATERL